MTKIHELAEFGQSIWLDYIRRSFIAAGELQDLVDDGLRGVTSNPSIFEKAIAGSTDYDDDLRRLANEGKSVDEIYEALAVEDIQRAADVLRPVYDATDGADGYVSLEVRPELAHETEETIEEARHLFAEVDRPNVMIKVPATPEGMLAIRTLIGEGVNVNVTLMFSLEQYDAVAEAYIAGLEDLVANGGGPAINSGRRPSQVASVASFFISRVDVKVDQVLDNIDMPAAKELKGKIGIANAKMVYQRFKETFAGSRWDKLAEQGALPQRVLWASTSTKDPTYPDTLYADNLIGPHTVNTLPPATLRAFMDHGAVASTVESDLDAVREQLDQLAALDIDLDTVTDGLLDEGIAKFIKPFDDLMDSIAEKRQQLEAGWQPMEATLAQYEDAVNAAIAEIVEDEIMTRSWSRDHTVWQSEPTEITNRLGWLHIPQVMMENVGRLKSLAEHVQAEGYTHVLLMGMGGSSLAPELFSKVFADEAGLDLNVLDSTDPAAVRAYQEQLDPTRTLFIVATKSGGTAETLSFFKHFYNWTADAMGADAMGADAASLSAGRRQAGGRFVAITDPGSKLVALADEYGFRTTFCNDPNIGGRYSALSFFGLAPAALVGVDVQRLLDSALTAACNCESCVAAEDNLGAQLGAILGELAKAGRDKLTLVTSSEIASFGGWVEQLIAESTGKSGTGILPVVGEPLGAPDVYGDDRVFVHVHLEGDTSDDDALAALEEAGHPVVRIHLRDRYDLGGQFFLWEMATAVAGHRLGIHPFNQPNVEAAKVQARKMIDEYTATGKLPEQTPALTTNGFEVHGDVAADSVSGAVDEFLKQAEAGDYISLQAYVPPTEGTESLLRSLQAALRDKTKLATTVGFGPRFLHSTGQLHKGDAGNGLFIQFTSDPQEDVAIPDEAGSDASSITFGVLKLAQAMGDRQALLGEGRRVIRIHLGADAAGGLEEIEGALT
ncbi:MAG: Transaldolase [Anaerolineales bacterium]|nr:Transaldolase [Anaerolineales bacterium]